MFQAMYVMQFDMMGSIGGLDSISNHYTQFY